MSQKRAKRERKKHKENERVKNIYGIENEKIELTPIEIERVMKKAIEQGMEEQLAFDVQFFPIAALKVLHDELGFGKKRIMRIAQRLNKDYSQKNDEKVWLLNQYKKFFKEKMDIEFLVSVNTKGGADEKGNTETEENKNETTIESMEIEDTK